MFPMRIHKENDFQGVDMTERKETDSVISYDSGNFTDQLNKKIKSQVDAYEKSLVTNVVDSMVIGGGLAPNKQIPLPIPTKEEAKGFVSSAIDAIGSLFSSKKDEDENIEDVHDTLNYDEATQGSWLAARDDYVILSTLLLKSITANIQNKPLPPSFYDDFLYLIGSTEHISTRPRFSKGVIQNLGFASREKMLYSFRKSLIKIGDMVDRVVSKKLSKPVNYKTDVNYLSDAMDNSEETEDYDLDSLGDINEKRTN
jgi:hypothetical protein